MTTTHLPPAKVGQGGDGTGAGPEQGCNADPILTQAARSLSQINRPFEPTNVFTPDHTDQMALRQLAASLQAPATPHTILLMQAHVLDALFNRMVMKTLENTRRDPQVTDNCISQNMAALALQSQRQCRATLDILSLLPMRWTKVVAAEKKTLVTKE